ncbi:MULTISPECIES: hypothetical protein [unclassified Novosphingobium]|uniref:hypothetical protein n=1 Tax=unclassified Novosphingobium TaxID=2644732 RepID=UPI0025D3E6D8|nr:MULTISPECIES: hypothetical protein [unclassified Novosphingobium]HQV03995.1 hypothetical protein [Novosphingobium sp.]
MVLLVGLGLAVPAALAQDAAAPAEKAVKSAPALAPAAPLTGPTTCPPVEPDAEPRCIPPLTPVLLLTRTHLGSKISKSGEMFEFVLDQPVTVNGKVLVPAGTRGVGEVVHAKKSGGSGASGELVLAARYLDVGGRKLRLRSLHFAAAGQDRIGTVTTMSVASPALALVGFFVKGKGIDLPVGTQADAKTAEAFLLDPPTDPAAPASPPAATPEPVQPLSQ